ncbi:knotted carbamoyltransferase YgeW, partial [candidate division CSSED10-310 bacterium]
PFHIMEERTELLSARDQPGLKELEQRCLENNAHFKHWECNEQNMALTAGGEALYMHCLPADISGVSCQAGEVSQNVFEHYRTFTYKEASWKPFIIAAMIFLAKCAPPAAVLQELQNHKK